ncbi:MAG: site-specific integrase [Erysipelotrichaceae bacterium]|nr:site-specific integrase [Erysipelotrichaceae bacterium]
MPAYKDSKRNTWYASFYVPDETAKLKTGSYPKKTKRGFSTKKEALKYEREFITKYKRSVNMSFKSLWELFFEDSQARLKPSTLSSYQSIYNLHFAESFNAYDINSITPAMIREWQNELIKKGLSLNSIHLVEVVLVSVFKFAVKYYDLPVNPFEKVDKVGKQRKEKPMVIWTVNDLDAALEYEPDNEFRTAYTLLFFSGMRIREMIALQWQDIDFDSKTVHIERNLQKDGSYSTPKSGKDRFVTLPDEVIQALKDYKSQSYCTDLDSPVFHHNYASYDRHLKTIIQKSGLSRITLHDLRHSHASMLIEMNVNPLVISERLGHADVQLTLNVYSHLYPNKQAETANMIQGFINQNRHVNTVKTALN